jgi:hypothetical protein
MIVFNDIRHGHKIAGAAGSIFNPACDQCISNVVGGELLGGLTFQGYTGASIQGHMAGFHPNWLTRDLIWVGFDYPFNQLGCSMIFAQIPETNTRSLEMNQKLGFKIVSRIEGVFPDGACMVLALAREDCRWLDLKPRGLRAGSEG